MPAPTDTPGTPSEDEFLRALNADLPPGVDWKQGAVTYLRELVAQGGEGEEWFHLVKPFVGGPDFSPFWVDVFQFLDVIHAADLDHASRVLDVGCGPGWTIQWLAKLGHHVIGIDISQELLDIAERRMQTDPYHPFPDRPFSYDLRNHDIEARPLGLDRPVDLGLFESTLHHFENPVAALRNVGDDLGDRGLVAVIEAAAPPVGSTWHAQNVELMRRYHTIERPYTREQLYDMLELAGFEYAEFYRPVNGLVGQDVDSIGPVTYELARADNINIFFAARSRSAMERIAPRVEPLSRGRAAWRPLEGCYAPEARPDGSRYRWCGPRVLLRTAGAGRHALTVNTVGLDPGQVQHVFALVDGVEVQRVALTAALPSVVLALHTAAAQVVELQSDRVFSPGWHGQPDPRVLSFTLDLPG